MGPRNKENQLRSLFPYTDYPKSVEIDSSYFEWNSETMGICSCRLLVRPKQKSQPFEPGVFLSKNFQNKGAFYKLSSKILKW